MPIERRVLSNVILLGEALKADKSEQYRFVVLESFTRNAIEGQTIDATNGPCGGIQYKPGKQYLLYGSRLGSFYQVGTCSGSRDVEGAAEEIDYVREWTRTHTYSQNELSGTLFDSSGGDVEGICVELVAADELEPNTNILIAFADETGRFQVTKIPPGDYILAVNPFNRPVTFLPYSSQFFPGVFDRANATRIQVHGPERLGNYDFILQDRIPMREVRVHVEWFDGSPVTNAYIGATAGLDGDEQESSSFTDENGIAKFTFFTTHLFEIHLDHLDWRKSDGLPFREEFPPLKLSAGPGVDSLHFSLTVPEKHDMRRSMRPPA